MSNVSSLFENLMTYSDTKVNTKPLRKKIDENDQTLLNLTVELPSDTSEIDPEDIKVDVGVMNVDDEGAEEAEANDEEMVDDAENDLPMDDTDVDEIDITPENEEDTKEPEKEESLKLRREAIHKRRLEAKKLKENKAKDEEKEECKSCDKEDNKKEEATDVETAKNNIRKRVNGKDEGLIDGVANTVKSTLGLGEKKESLMHLDTTSLNKLITNFVKDNYKNIDKVTITKAILENRQLTLKGYIKDVTGQKEAITLVNRGFDAKKLENTRFLIDFKDMSQTFGVIKESLKKPFVFTANMKNGVVKFENLKYDFKTKLAEGKIAHVTGKCVLNENVKPVNEDANQVKTFNEIAEKIKNAKSANDLLACKDEMNNSNIGDTLLSALQMIWDDVNSRMKASTK